MLRRFPLYLLLILSLAACDGSPEMVTRVVEVTRLIPNPSTPTIIEVTRLVPNIAATATPALVETPPAFRAPDPGRLRHAVEVEPLTLDPALATDPAGVALIQNVVEPLLFPDPAAPGTYLPLLAADWDISEDGLTYVFRIRPEVSFSDGSPLTPTDIAYSLQRALLLSDPAGNQGQLLEPLLGYTSGDITEEINDGVFTGDRESLLTSADARDMLAVCERVKGAIVGDDLAGTVTITLSQSWGPLLATLSQPWTAAVDRDWAIDLGAWDDNCETWQNWYAPGRDSSALTGNVMGTGPYVLDHWTPGVEYVLMAQPDYWRDADNPLLQGEQEVSGPARIETIVVQVEPDAVQRLALLQDGDVEIADLPPALRILADQDVGEICAPDTQSCTESGRPEAPLRRVSPLYATSRTDLLFNFDINTENNFFLGSGQLDGGGIPADFFSDLDIRRGFSHCLDTALYTEQALYGENIANNGVIPPPLLGYNPEQEMRSLDLELCAEALATAWEGQVAAVGFRLQIPFASEDRTQEVALANLQANLHAVNPAYRLETVGLPPALYNEALQNGRLPLLFHSWTQTLPDPHNWTTAYYADPIPGYQRLPADLRAQIEELVAAGAAATGPAGRERIYFDLGRVRYTTIPNLILPQPAGVAYHQRWLAGWYYHPLLPTPYYYSFALSSTE